VSRWLNLLPLTSGGPILYGALVVDSIRAADALTGKRSAVP
jgi:hypothetical protein